MESGCATTSKSSVHAPTPPPQLTNLDNFADALNHFVLLSPEDSLREPYRVALRDYLVKYIEKNLREEQYQEALTALQLTTHLYRPAELQQGPRHDPALTQAAKQIFQTAARQGQTEPAMFALAIQEHFGNPSERKQARDEWATVAKWLVENSDFGPHPLFRHEELEKNMEEIAAYFPSPFIVQKLADVYIQRYQVAVSVQRETSEIGLAAKHRADVSGYLLIRLYLRADDLDKAKQVAKQVSIDPPTRRLIEFIEQVTEHRKSAGPFLTLAAQFTPERQDNEQSSLPPALVAQGWGISENLARRALARDGQNAFAHLLLARCLRQSGMLDAAIFHFEAAIRHKEDLFVGWQELAPLYQEKISRLSHEDLDQALHYLERIDAFHKSAATIWKDRPIEPQRSQAYFSVAVALFEVGQVDRAKHLLEQSIRLEPTPEALELLGNIDFNQANDTQAAQRYEALLSLAFVNQEERLRWESLARFHLARIAQRKGQPAQKMLQDALNQLNTLLSRNDMDTVQRSHRLIERGKLLFFAGDTQQAFEDFREARSLSSDRDDAYAIPLLFVVSHGYYREALEIYLEALANNQITKSAKLYFSLWVTELALRQGRPQDMQALAYIRNYQGHSWHANLALHAQGKLTFEQLLGHANDAGEKAEAYFYEGIRRWRLGNPNAGKNLLRKVLDTQMMGFFEYSMAMDYLEWDDLPVQARNPTAKPVQ